MSGVLGEIVIDPHFNGPPGTGNGGYACGRVAAFLGGRAEVTLRRPPPLGRPLSVEERGEGVLVLDRAELVAEARPAEVAIEPPAPPTLEEATEASRRYPGFEHHAYPTCFVCGPLHEDGLRIFSGQLPGSDVVAAPWTPGDHVGPEFVWAALDCPGAIAVGFPERGDFVLGRLAATIDRVPGSDEACVVVGWPLGREGRKAEAGTALYAADGELLGIARSTWIDPRK
jgi:hypothetical protein